MAHPARTVANYFIEKAIDEGDPLTHMEVQKLVYFAQGNTLHKLRRPLVKETFEAWDHGPVIRSLYIGLKYHGADPVDFPLRTFLEPSFTDEELDVLDETYERYAHLSAAEMRRLSHKKGTPWQKLCVIPGKPEIPNHMIRRYFDGYDL